MLSIVHRQKRPRNSVIGRWNGVLYFVPLVLLAVARLDMDTTLTSALTRAARLAGYALFWSTLVSIIDRATAAHGVQGR